MELVDTTKNATVPCLWNELPTDLREPRQTQSPSLSPITHGISSSSSLPSSRSALAREDGKEDDDDMPCVIGESEGDCVVINKTYILCVVNLNSKH